MLHDENVAEWVWAALVSGLVPGVTVTWDGIITDILSREQLQRGSETTSAGGSP